MNFKKDCRQASSEGLADRQAREEKMMKLSKSLALTFCLGLAALPACADSLKLVGTGPTAVDGVYVYPYNFNVTSHGTTTSTSLMCIDFSLHTDVNEQWTVDTSSIPTDNSTYSTQLRALSLIDYALATGYGGLSPTDLQFADWSILEPTAVDGLKGYTSGNAATIAADAMFLAGNQSLIASGFYSQFTLYTPDANNAQGWTDGPPQDFIGYTPAAPAPEPSSLALMGSGLLGVMETLRRRAKAVQA